MNERVSDFSCQTIKTISNRKEQVSQRKTREELPEQHMVSFFLMSSFVLTLREKVFQDFSVFQKKVSLTESSLPETLQHLSKQSSDCPDVLIQELFYMLIHHLSLLHL